MDLDNAIAYHRNAIVLQPNTDPNYPSFLNNLALALQMQFTQRGQEADLGDAIGYHHKAVAL